MIRRLVEEGGLRGFHFCTLNLEKSVQNVLEILKWTPGHAKVLNRLIAVSFRDRALQEYKVHELMKGVYRTGRTTYDYKS